MILNSRLIKLKGVRHALSDRRWSRRMDKSKGFRAGKDLTMFPTSFSICAPELMSFVMGRICSRMFRMLLCSMCVHISQFVTNLNSLRLNPSFPKRWPT